MYRRMSCHLVRFLGVVAGVALLAGGPLATPVRADRNMAQLANDLDAIASQLSSLVMDNRFRVSLSKQIKESPRRDVSALRDLVGFALTNGMENDSGRLLTIAARVEQCEANMKLCALPNPRVEVKVPVAAHRELLNDSDQVYVAVAPLEEESEVKSITAYSNGKRISLSVAEPPKIPTLVVLPAETASEEPGIPTKINADPNDDEPESALGGNDDRVGIVRLLITDDHESWVCGDPEIYLRVIRWQLPNCRLINERVSFGALNGVNDEDVWYYLNDQNPSYKYVDTAGYIPYIQFQVWESDSGAHGGDDHVGTITLQWTGQSFTGYTTRSGGDARIQTDRDP